MQSGCKSGICGHSASAFGNLVSMPIAALGLSGHCNGYRATVAVICNRYEKALGQDYTSTLDIVNNLGVLYADKGKLSEAEKMYQRVLEEKGKVLGLDHTSTLDTVQHLGILYKSQSKLGEAEKMYQRVLEGYEKALGPELSTSYIPALNTTYNLGLLFTSQGDIGRAREMYLRSLVGYQKVFGHNHQKCQDVQQKLSAIAQTNTPVSKQHRLLQNLVGDEPNVSKQSLYILLFFLLLLSQIL